MGPNAKGALLALGAFALYAAHDVVIKTLGGSYHPVQIVFFAVLFSFPLLAMMLMRDQNPGTLLPKHPGWMAARSVATVIGSLCGFYAFTVLPLAQTYALLFAMPLLVTVLAIPVLGETVGLRRGLAVVAGLVGVIVVLRPGETELSLGHAAAITAAVAASIATIAVRRVGADERAVVILVYPMMANFVVMAAALGFVYEPMPVEHLGLLALLAALSWLGGRIIIEAYRLGEAVIVAPMQYSQILWATFWGWLLFSETPDLWTGTGAGIIIASGVVIVLREGRSTASRHRPVLSSRARSDLGAGPRISALERLLHRKPNEQ